MFTDIERLSAVEMAVVSSLSSRYALAMDTHRFDLFDQVFAVRDLDCEFVGKRFTNLEDLKTHMRRWHSVFDAHSHSVANHSWRFEGTKAWVVTYGIARYMRHGTPGGDYLEIEGWYDDELVQTPGGWRIRRRVANVWRLAGNPDVASLGDGSSSDLVELKSLLGAARDGALPPLFDHIGRSPAMKGGTP